MFKREPDRKSFTARDIQRYIDGRMSPAERNELERAALGDPFLEDALEGYASLTPGNPASVQEDLSAMRSRLARRVRSAGRKRVLLSGNRQAGDGMRAGGWIRAAAILVILAGAGILLYVRMQRDSTRRHKDLAVRSSGVRPAVIQPPAIHIQPPGAAGAPRSARPPGTPVVPAPAGRVRQTVSSAGTPGYRLSDSVQPALANMPVSPYLRRDTLFDKIPHPVQYRNRVIDFNNQPIIGATVRILPSGAATLTDRNGNFNFGADSIAGDSNATVMIEAVGYAPRQYPVSQMEQLPAIQLKETTGSLSDVVAIGYGTRKKALTRKMNTTYHAIDDSTGAQPINGWSAFNRYVFRNMEIPAEVLRKDIHGEVVLSFKVDGGGKPVGISVDKSLCVPCDTEAIRLLKEGPQWTKGKKKHAKGHVRVRF